MIIVSHKFSQKIKTIPAHFFGYMKTISIIISGFADLPLYRLTQFNGQLNIYMLFTFIYFLIFLRYRGYLFVSA